MPISYRKISDRLETDLIDEDDLIQLESSARAMTFDHCLDLLFLSKNELSKNDLAILEKLWRRGRAGGLNAASDALFGSMIGKSAHASAMDYLRHLADDFSQDSGPVGKSFSFSMNFGDDPNSDSDSDSDLDESDAGPTNQEIANANIGSK